ncbi:MAG: ribonuclease HII, partial [Actinomycetes bacterium]
TLDFESPFLHDGRLVVGIDEVGRGAYAGPVTVGAVGLRNAKPIPTGLKDSKLLTARARELLIEPIQSWADVWGVGSSTAEEIDMWGIRIALAVAADRALATLGQPIEHLLIDGPSNLLRCPMAVPLGVMQPPIIHFASTPAHMIVKGDQKSATIGAAAVLAKVSRDAYMTGLSDEYPQYEWSGNKGYGAPGHIAAIATFGLTAYHRKSWNIT